MIPVLSLLQNLVSRSGQTGRRTVDDVHRPGTGVAPDTLPRHTDSQITKPITVEIPAGHRGAELVTIFPAARKGALIPCLLTDPGQTIG